jgi:hypothetical protein
VESTIRSLSNLNERLHQSFYYYILANTFRYVSIGQYLIPYFIILGSMCAFAASRIISVDANPFLAIAVPRTIVFYLGGAVLFQIIVKITGNSVGMISFFRIHCKITNSFRISFLVVLGIINFYAYCLWCEHSNCQSV